MTAKLQDETLADLASDFSNYKKLKAVSVDELLQHEFKPRELILSPWMGTQSLNMIYAYRGVGKTHVSLGIAYAVASGSEFLGWRCNKPRGVLFIDGEMPGAAIQERINNIATTGIKPKAPLMFLTPDLQEFGMPDLATRDGQLQIEKFITDEIELIIIDNLSCLVRSGKENEGESWLPIQDWALGLRAKGKSVLFIHHSNKGGNQRGTSRREDVLDTVLSLRRPPDYISEQGALFEVHFEKSRHLYGEEVAPFEAQLSANAAGDQCWLIKALEESTFEKVVSLRKDGLSQKDISEELSVNKSTVSRHIKNATNSGLLSAGKSK